MKNLKKFLIPMLVLLILVIPVISSADGLVPCNNNSVITKDVNGNNVAPIPCDFNAFMNLINTVIKFILFGMAIPISAIMFAYAGFIMVTAGDEAAHARTKAKEIFTNTVIGLVIAVAAFLIVKTILSILGYTGGSWIGF